MEAVLRGCGITVLVAFCVMCALVLGLLWQMHRAWNRPPPDVGAFAHSAATRTADAADAQRSSERLADLGSALPWAVPLGTSVADSCRTQEQSSLFGKRNWEPVTCTRSSVLYVAFDGDIHTHLRQLDTLLARQEWLAGDSPQGMPTRTPTRLSKAGADPSPAVPERGSTETPSPRPICLSEMYGPPHGLPHGGTGVRLRVAVAERPCTPDAITGDVQVGLTPQKSTTDPTVYLDWRPLSTGTVSATAFASHRYVAAFSLVDAYAAQSPATTSPAPPPTR